MFCIASFIILGILGIFSASYRKLAGKAWQCVLKRITFKPCDVNFGEELKGKVLGKIILTHPRLYRFLSRWFDALALIFVILTIWSVLVAAIALLNLAVYDTCNPQNAESCSLSGEACSIASANITFVDSLFTNQELTWIGQEFTSITTALTLLPSRFQHWEASNYIASNATYYHPFDAKKTTALVIIDPGCPSCANDFRNIQQVGFENNYNLTYLAYPIPNGKGGYKFANSHLMASYLEAVKVVAPAHATAANIAPDWQLLEKIFTATNSDGKPLQSDIDYVFDSARTKEWMHTQLADIGYTSEQVAVIDTLATSDQVRVKLSEQKNIVENKVHTVKIPTIMFDGRRYDRVLQPTQL